jgi:hypothetical protein
MPIRPVAYACVLAALVTTACGKKGPPLVPYAKAPGAPAEVTARRLGNRVEIRFTVPTVDLDGQRPAHIDRIEVWAVTGQVPDPILFLKYATLVGTVPVRRPPPPPPDVEEGKPPPPPPPPSTDPDSTRDSLESSSTSSAPKRWCPSSSRSSEKHKARDEELRLKGLAEQEPPRLTPPDLGTPIAAAADALLRRHGPHTAAARARRHSACPWPLRPAPPAPPQPTPTLAENYVELAWTAPPGLPKPVHKGTAVAPAGASRGAATRPSAPAAAPGEAPPIAPTEEKKTTTRSAAGACCAAASAGSDASRTCRDATRGACASAACARRAWRDCRSRGRRCR